MAGNNLHTPDENTFNRAPGALPRIIRPAAIFGQNVGVFRPVVPTGVGYPYAPQIQPMLVDPGYFHAISVRMTMLELNCQKSSMERDDFARRYIETRNEIADLKRKIDDLERSKAVLTAECNLATTKINEANISSWRQGYRAGANAAIVVEGRHVDLEEEL